MEYQITGEITSTSDAETLSTLEWLKDNYGTKIHNAGATGSTKRIQFGLVETTFNDTVVSLTALKTQFGARLVDWHFSMNQ